MTARITWLERNRDAVSEYLAAGSWREGRSSAA
jgi:hypothetical protein